MPVSEDFLVADDEGCHCFIENFDFVSENMKDINKKYNNLRFSADSFTSTTTKKTEERNNQVFLFSEESCIYSSSNDGEFQMTVNEVPRFESKFLND